tara:strand:+ start:157 stop:393 length:237 start_codon:yes stop_codon:yes gene_type:complete
LIKKINVIVTKPKGKLSIKGLRTLKEKFFSKRIFKRKVDKAGEYWFKPISVCAGVISMIKLRKNKNVLVFPFKNLLNK